MLFAAGLETHRGMEDLAGVRSRAESLLRDGLVVSALALAEAAVSSAPPSLLSSAWQLLGELSWSAQDPARAEVCCGCEGFVLLQMCFSNARLHATSSSCEDLVAWLARCRAARGDASGALELVGSCCAPTR